MYNNTCITPRVPSVTSWLSADPAPSTRLGCFGTSARRLSDAPDLVVAAFYAFMIISDSGIGVLVITDRTRRPLTGWAAPDKSLSNQSGSVRSDSCSRTKLPITPSSFYVFIILSPLFFSWLKVNWETGVMSSRPPSPRDVSGSTLLKKIH